MNRTRECAARQRPVLLIILTLAVVWASEPSIKIAIETCKEIITWPR